MRRKKREKEKAAYSYERLYLYIEVHGVTRLKAAMVIVCQNDPEFHFLYFKIYSYTKSLSPVFKVQLNIL